jgi:AcrR family transcriptional regulator
MPPRTAQRADAVRNRRAILDAAGRLLLEHGDLSMSELARVAGLTRPTLYRHFPDREHVLDALARDLGPVVVARLLETFEGLPLGDALDRLAADVVDVARQHRELLDAGHRQLHELARLIVPGEPIARLLEERRTSGELPPTLDVDWLARCIRALCLTAIDDTRHVDAVRADLARSLRALTA